MDELPKFSPGALLKALTAAKVLADSAADNSGQRHASTVLQLLALAVLQTRKADVL